MTVLPWLFRGVYGTAFSEGVGPLTALLMGTPFCALGQIYTGLFTVQGSMGKIFWSIFAMVALNLTIAWVLVSRGRANVQSVALAFSAGFLAAQFLMFYFQHHALQEPVLRMGTLLLTTAVFSGGQFLLPGGWLRVLWGLLSCGALIVAVRMTQTVDKTLLENLFEGRLAPGGRGLAFLLVARS